MKKLLILLQLVTTIIFAQQDSAYYNTGELMSISSYHESGIMKSRTYFYKTGELKGSSFYDYRGVLNDGYTLNLKSDTISKSNVPLFNAQPIKDLNFIKWKKKKTGISVFIERKGKGKKFTKGDEVEIGYIGYFENGAQFDNSEITQYKLNFTIGSGMMLSSFENGLLL